MLWRIPSLLGGAGGLASFLLPYALVTGSGPGPDVGRQFLTLFELAKLLENAGNDSGVVYVLGFLIFVGSTMALVGAVAQSSMALGGGLIQGGTAVAFAYGLTTRGTPAVLFGLGRIDATLETGFFVLAGASALSVLAWPLDLLVRRL